MKATPEDVRHAYRLLLGREPDRGGRETFERLIRQSPMAPIALADLIMRSDEYRQRETDGFQLVGTDLGGYSVFARKGDALIGSHLTAGIPYEPYVMKHFDESLSKATVVLDIGANIGIFTMRAASRIPRHGKVIAVEPLAQNLRALYQGIHHNRFEHVEVLPFAASDRFHLVSMVCADDSSNGIVTDRVVTSDDLMFVPAHGLDPLLSALDRLDVVKMDIEGHEPEAWLGMTSLLRRFHPTVFTEFSPILIRGNSKMDPEGYISMLLEYSPVIRVLHRDDKPRECRSVSDVMTQWEMANRRFGLKGELHLDLLLN